jgi:hypothetical protein
MRPILFQFAFFWAQNVILHMSTTFDNIYYLPSHSNQIFILNFGLLKWVMKHIHISIYQNIETAGVLPRVSVGI